MPMLTAADVAHLKAGTSALIRAASVPGSLYQWSGTLAGPVVASPYGLPVTGGAAPLWLGPVLVRDAAGKPGPELVEVIEPKPDGPTVTALVDPGAVTYRLTEAGRRALEADDERARCMAAHPAGKGRTYPDEDGGTIYAGRR